MNWIYRAIGTVFMLLLLSGCAGKQDKKENISNHSKFEFVKKLTNKYHIRINNAYPLFIFYIMPYDCISCMYNANDFLANFLTDSLPLPRSNVLFLFPTISNRDFKYLREKYYTFDFSGYKIIKSDSLSEVMSSRYGKPVGAMIYVIDKNDSLLYIQALKHIVNKDTLERFLSADKD